MAEKDVWFETPPIRDDYQLAATFPTVIFCELAGFPPEDYPRIMDWKNTIMHRDDGHPRGRELARARAEAMGLDLGEGLPQIVLKLSVHLRASLFPGKYDLAGFT